MTTQNRIVRLENVQDQALRERIERLGESTGDVHLIEAAVQSDGFVSSCDNTARRRYARAAVVLTEIARIIWICPPEEEDGGSDWVARGALFEEARTLANAPQMRMH